MNWSNNSGVCQKTHNICFSKLFEQRILGTNVRHMHIETKQSIQVNYLVQTGFAAFDNTAQLIRRPQPIFPTYLARWHIFHLKVINYQRQKRKHELSLGTH